MKKKVLTFFLAACLCVAMVPVTAFAEEATVEGSEDDNTGDTVDDDSTDDSIGGIEEDADEDNGDYDYNDEDSDDESSDEGDSDDVYVAIEGGYKVIPGNSVELTALVYSYDDEMMDSSDYTYEWSVGEYEQDTVPVTLSNTDSATVTVTADASAGEGEVSIEVIVSDKDGNVTVSGSTTVYITEEYYEIIPDYVWNEMVEGESYTYAPSVIYYDSENPNGTPIDFTFTIVSSGGSFNYEDEDSFDYEDVDLSDVVDMVYNADGTITITAKAVGSEYTYNDGYFTPEFYTIDGDYIGYGDVGFIIYHAEEGTIGSTDENNNSGNLTNGDQNAVDGEIGAGDAGNDNSNGNTSSASDASSTSGTVKTGDTQTAMLYVVIIAICAATAGVLVFRRRRI